MHSAKNNSKVVDPEWHQFRDTARTETHSEEEWSEEERVRYNLDAKETADVGDTEQFVAGFGGSTAEFNTDAEVGLAVTALPDSASSESTIAGGIPSAGITGQDTDETYVGENPGPGEEPDKDIRTEAIR